VTSSLRARVRSGELTVGTFVNLGSVLAAETCALAGFDWLVVDLEHGGGAENALVGQILAAGVHQVPVIVRVESGDRIRSGRVLDLGAAGVMLPRLSSAEEATRAVGHLRYPPAGDRGVATYNRACGFGLRTETLATANDEVVGIVQIETLGALAEVEEIAQVPGVDVLFVGPLDLSHALGVPGMFETPEFHAALTKVTTAAQTAGIAAGILAPDPDRARESLDVGFSFVAVASDSALLARAAREAFSPVRAEAQALASR
jgi:2-keto-3-deoxy-L-rhamnonate aldolase RhmA